MDLMDYFVKSFLIEISINIFFKYISILKKKLILFNCWVLFRNIIEKFLKEIGWLNRLLFLAISVAYRSKSLKHLYTTKNSSVVLFRSASDKIVAFV